MIAQADLGPGPCLLEPELGGAHETNEQRVAQCVQAGQCPLPGDIPVQGPAQLVHEHLLPWSFAGVSATEPERLLEQAGGLVFGVASGPQVVLDGSTYDRLVEMVGQLFPRAVRARLRHRIATALGERSEGLVPQLLMLDAVLADALPEILLL